MWQRSLLVSCLDLSMLLQIIQNKNSPSGNLSLILQTEGKCSCPHISSPFGQLQSFIKCEHACLTHYNNSTRTEGSIKTIMLIILHQGAVTETFFICASRPSLVQLSALNCREKPLETHQITNMPMLALTATMYHIKSEPR